MSAMFVHFSTLLSTARSASERASRAAVENPGAFPEDALVSILLAAAAAEGFINELAESAAMRRDAPPGRSPSIPAAVGVFADALEEIEGARGSVKLKYLIAARTLSGSSFDKGAAPFQDFATLVTLRNDIVHLKPRDRFRGPVVDASSVEPPEHIAVLQQRGLARKPVGGAALSWFDAIRTHEMAAWACDAATAIIVAVLRMLPAKDLVSPGAFWLFAAPFKDDFTPASSEDSA